MSASKNQASYHKFYSTNGVTVSLAKYFVSGGDKDTPGTLAEAARLYWFECSLQ